MHGRPTPPPIAPPVVPPPLPSERLPGERLDAQYDGPPPITSSGPSFLSRLGRDLKIGSFCLLAGLVVGQSGLLRRGATTSAPLAAALPNQEFSLDGSNQSSLPVTFNAEPKVYEVTSAAVEFSRNDEEQESLQQQESLNTAELDDQTAKPALQSVELTRSSPQNEMPEAKPVEAKPVAPKPVEAKPSSPVGPMDGSTIANKETPPRSLFGKADPNPVASLIRLNSSSSVVHPVVELETCGPLDSHGTVLKWADTPADAYRLANEQEKLVFLIHVSGNFEIPGFT